MTHTVYSILYKESVRTSYRAGESLISTSAVIKSWLRFLLPLFNAWEGVAVGLAAGDGWPCKCTIKIYISRKNSLIIRLKCCRKLNQLYHTTNGGGVPFASFPWAANIAFSFAALSFAASVADKLVLLELLSFSEDGTSHLLFRLKVDKIMIFIIPCLPFPIFNKHMAIIIVLKPNFSTIKLL